MIIEGQEELSIENLIRPSALDNSEIKELKYQLKEITEKIQDFVDPESNIQNIKKQQKEATIIFNDETHE